MGVSLTRRHHVYHFTKASELCFRTDGREARHGFIWHRRSLGEEVGGSRIRQGTTSIHINFASNATMQGLKETEFYASKSISRPFSTPSSGLRGSRSVLATEEERRAVLQLAQGDVRCQQETASGLRQVFEGVVRVLHVPLIASVFTNALRGRKDVFKFRRWGDVCRVSSAELDLKGGKVVGGSRLVRGLTTPYCVTIRMYLLCLLLFVYNLAILLFFVKFSFLSDA